MYTHFSWVYFVTFNLPKSTQVATRVKHCSVSKPKAQSLWHCCLKGIIYSLLMSSFSSSFFDMESRRTSASFMCSGIMRLGFSAGVLTRGGGGGGRYGSFFFLGLSLAYGITNQQTNIDLKKRYYYDWNKIQSTKQRAHRVLLICLHLSWGDSVWLDRMLKFSHTFKNNKNLPVSKNSAAA